jgi:two-component system, cell cycle sensor histidine kinase and response regulator CckA
MAETVAILIVDDDKGACYGLLNIFKKRGFKPKSAGTGREALAAAREKFFNVVLLGIELPDMPGTELIAPLKKIHPDAAIIMIAANSTPDTAVRSLNEGAAGYLTKPLNMEEVLAKVDEAIERQRLLAENRRQDEDLRRELADRRKTDENLLRATQEWRAAFDSITDLISILDADYRIVRVSKSLADFLKTSPKELIGKRCYEVIHGTKEPPPFCLHKKVFETKQSVEQEILDPRLGIYMHLVDSPILGANGDVIGSVHITKNITDRKRAEEALQQSERKWRKLFESSRDVIYLSTAEGRFLDINRAGEDLYGYTHEELLEIDIRSLYKRPHERDILVEKTRRQGFVKDYETAFIRKDGTVVDCLITATALKNDDGEFIGTQGAIRDVTERKRMDEALRKSEEKYRDIFETAIEGIYQTTPEGRYISANPAFARILGYSSPEQLIGAVTDIGQQLYVDPRRRDEIKDMLARDGAVQNFEAELRRRDKSTIWVIIDAAVIRDESGSMHHYQGTMLDITDRKRAEQLTNVRITLLEFAVAHSLGELLQKTLDEVGMLTGSPIGFYHFVDEDQKSLTLQAWSTKTLQEFCKTEGMGMHYGIDKAGVWVDCVHERRPVIHNDYSALPNKKGMPKGHAEVIRELVLPIMRSGKIVAILGVGNKLTDYTQQDVNTVSYLADIAWEIAHRKRAEEALKKERQDIMLILDSSPNVIFYKDKEGKHIRVNKTFAMGLGRTEEEIVGKTVFDLFSPEVAQSMTDSDQEVMKSGRPKLNITESYESAGGIRWIQIDKIPIYDANNNVIGLAGFAQDITERKEAEEALRQSDVRFKKLSANVPGMIYQFLKRPDGTYCVPFTTESIRDVFGCSPEDVREDFSAIVQTILPEDLDKVVNTIESSAERMTDFQCEYRVQIPGGPVRWMFGHSTPEKLADGSVVWHGFNTDITESKQAEEALRESEEQYRSLVENINDVVYNMDSSGTISYMSPVVETITGNGSDEYIGKSFAEFIHPDDLPKLMASFETTMQGIKEDAEFRVITKDGSYRYVRSSSSLIVEAGSVVGMTGLITDVTDRRRAEEALRDSEEKFRNLFRTSRDFLSITDLEGKIIDVNDAAVKFFGYSFEDISGMHMYDLYADPEDRKLLTNAVIESGYVLDREIRMKKKNGEIIDALVTANLIRNNNGNPIGFFGSAKDVTEKKRMEQQLLQSEKLSAVGTMISGVAHELNNPLTSIIGNAQLLSKRELPEHIRTKIDVILRESKRSAKIVGGLLAFAREHKPERRMIDINEVLAESLKLREYDLKVSSIEVRASLFENLPETYADPYQLQQVFVNLINNARDALAGQEMAALSISTYRKGDKILIEFDDNGPGIPDGLISRIFDPFFTTKDVGKGTGLGLSMSYGIVREHNGMISVESKPGKGTKFIITLPIIMGTHAKEKESKTTVKASPGSISLLVVDDEASLRTFLSEALTEAGFLVEKASTGEEAIDLLAKNKYDALISDIKMPGINGRELHNYIRKHNPEIAEKIIFITGDVLNKETESFLRITNNRFIEKPFNVDTLIAMLNDMLSK